MSKSVRCASSHPSRREALHALGLDVTYEKGEGSLLWQCGADRPVWDFLGGYGSTFFGHNHPVLVTEARRFFESGRVVHAQASVRPEADLLKDDLSAWLSRSLGDAYEVLLANTGAEAVEVAARHAELRHARRRAGIGRVPIPDSGRHPTVHLAVEGGYHGMTRLARSLTHGAAGKAGSALDGGQRQVVFLDPTDPCAVDRAVAGNSSGPSGDEVGWHPVAALFVEPIRGEGGIHPIDADVASGWRASCDRLGIPIVADEIQSGMGRTGTFVYAEQVGLRPEYVLLGKSLGGGIAKISAVCVRSDVFLPEFTLLHLSTFAEDDFSCAIARRALGLLDETDALRKAAARGGALLARLRALAVRNDDVIRAVRGHGLMIGVEWEPQPFERSNLLYFLETYGWRGYGAASYLLHGHGVRVAPTLSEQATLRIEPAYEVPDEAIDALLEGLDALCSILRAEDSAALVAPGLGLDPPAPAGGMARPRVLRRPKPAHVGFVGHFIDCEDVTLWDEPFSRLGPGVSGRFLDRAHALAEPILVRRDHVASPGGEEVTLTFIGLPVSSRHFHDALRTRGRHRLRRLVQRGVDLARREGCSVVGLGGYCSILTRNGKELDSHGMALTTGNGFTVGAGLEAMRGVAAGAGIEWENARAAVVGATGNIGSVCARILGGEVGSLVVIARDCRAEDAERLAARISAETGKCVEAASGPSACRGANVIVAASNEPGFVVRSEHVGVGAIVLNDLAVPADVDDAIEQLRPGAVVIRGGVIRTPCNPDWSVPGIPLAPGEMYACMAETVMMGLDRATEHGSFGALTAGRVLETLELSRRYGFTSVRPTVKSSY